MHAVSVISEPGFRYLIMHGSQGVRIDERKSDVIYIMSTVDILDDSLQKGNTMVSIEPPMKCMIHGICKTVDC